MIKHQLTNDNGLVMATVNWQFTDKGKSVSNKTHSLPNALHFVRQTEKKILVETLTKYINQRLHVYKYNYVGDLSMKRAVNLANIENLKSILAFQTLRGVCKTILLYKESLESILPPYKSRLYAHDSSTLRELFKDCNEILNSEIID